MKMNIKPKDKEYQQLQAIITEIMQAQTYPNWDFLNNVLSCKAILGEHQLWYSYGRLLIVPPEKKYGTMAKDLQTLDDWNTEADGSITLIGKDQKQVILCSNCSNYYTESDDKGICQACYEEHHNDKKSNEFMDDETIIREVR